MWKALVSLHHLTMRVIRAHKTSLTQQFALKCMYQANKMSVLGDFASDFVFSVEFWKCSDSVAFLFCFITMHVSQ
jgi:hypothetical protein